MALLAKPEDGIQIPRQASAIAILLPCGRRTVWCGCLVCYLHLRHIVHVVHQQYKHLVMAVNISQTASPVQSQALYVSPTPRLLAMDLCPQAVVQNTHKSVRPFPSRSS